MDAAIHAHAAQWIVDVGSVANEKGSPLPSGRMNKLNGFLAVWLLKKRPPP
jgi:hypothetical protein